MSRKVVLFGPLPPPYGGVSVYMSALFEHLKDNGVRMWALYGDDTDRPSGITFVKHRRLGIIRALFREGRGARILDATHFHFEYPNKILLPAWLAFKFLLGFEWHKNVHDGSLPTRYPDFTAVQRMLFGLAARQVDEFVVVSDALRHWLRDEIKVTQRITVIPSLLPIPPDYLDRALSPELETQVAPFLRSPRRVCAIGVFIEIYGFAHVVEAVEKLRTETGDDIGLVLVDGMFARDESYRELTLIGRDWITVLESVPNLDVYQILKRSHVFVRAFGHESYGISRVEAIWCGVPVVATRAGETRGMLTYDFGDVEELTRQLRRAIQDQPANDIAESAKLFQREAEQNLEALKRTLKVDETNSTSS
jgi:glycosyltransferase involved in cell wall biosynthesis